MKVVITNHILPAGVEVLEDAGHSVDTAGPADYPSRSQVLERIRGADAICTSLSDRVDAEFLDTAGPNLKVISNVAVGFNNIDLDECRKRSIITTHTPDVLTEATADLAFALIMAVTRRLGEAERFLRAGHHWQWNMSLMVGSAIQNKTFGLIGAGRIGKAVARKVKAFDMSIVYSGNHPMDPEDEKTLDAQFVSLDQLLTRSHVVSLHCPYRPENHHMIGAEQIAMMPAGSYLINTARGQLVDEQAMIDALDSGHLAGVGLDVFEDEPHVPQGLLDRENAILLPHIGSATMETRNTMSELVANNVVKVLAGEPPLTPIPGSYTG